MYGMESRFIMLKEAVFEAWRERKTIAVFGEPGNFATNWRLGPDKDYGKSPDRIVYVRNSEENRALWILDQPWSSRIGNEVVTAALHRINSKSATVEDQELIKDITGQNGIGGLVSRWMWFYRNYGDEIIKEAHDLVVPKVEVEKVEPRLAPEKTVVEPQPEQQPQPQPEAKPLYKSRTVIGNILATIIVSLLSTAGINLPPEQAATLVATFFTLLNLFFRAITKGPIK